jgi:hypothetical protein
MSLIVHAAKLDCRAGCARLFSYEGTEYGDLSGVTI